MDQSDLDSIPKVKLGNGVAVSYYVGEKGDLIGLIHFHVNYKDQGLNCGMGIVFDTPYTQKTFPESVKHHLLKDAESELTVSELIECVECGLRGHISDGRWIPWVAVTFPPPVW